MTRKDDSTHSADAEDLTVTDAVARYLASKQSFGRLAPATRKIHRSQLRRFAAMHGVVPFTAIDAAIVADYLDQQISEHVARAAHKVLRAFFRFGMAMRLRCDDPTKQIDAPKVKAGAGRQPWSDAELRQFEAAHPIGTKARLCFALALYTGQRRGDLLKIRHSDFGADGTLYVKQQKTGTELYLPVHPELRRIIDSSTMVEDSKKPRNCDASPCGADFLLVTKTGRQFGANDLSDQFRQWCNVASVTKTLHGLRATTLTKAAEAGCTAHEIAAISGHKTLSEVQRYTRASDQRRLAPAAMAKSGGSRFDVSRAKPPASVGFLGGLSP